MAKRVVLRARLVSKIKRTPGKRETKKCKTSKNEIDLSIYDYIYI